MGSRFLGNDEYAGPAEPGRDGFPSSRERRLGSRGWVPVCTGTTVGERERRSGGRGWVPVSTGTTVGGPGMGSRLHGNDGWGAGDGFPSSRERRLGSRGWVPVVTGTTVGLPGMGSRCHGNDGWGAGDGFPLSRERRPGRRERRRGGGSGIGGVVYFGVWHGSAGLRVFGYV